MMRYSMDPTPINDAPDDPLYPHLSSLKRYEPKAAAPLTAVEPPLNVPNLSFSEALLAATPHSVQQALADISRMWTEEEAERANGVGAGVWNTFITPPTVYGVVPDCMTFYPPGWPNTPALTAPQPTKEQAEKWVGLLDQLL